MEGRKKQLLFAVRSADVFIRIRPEMFAVYSMLEMSIKLRVDIDN